MFRSAALATAFLAAGQPARVAQVWTHGGRQGHNVVEVWDRRWGWVVIDPTTMRHVKSEDEPLAPEAGYRIGIIPPAGGEKLVSRLVSNSFYLDPDDGFLRGARVYPEPWLYLRTGPRTSAWPFRGRFAVVGRDTPRLGPRQGVLRAGLAVTAAGVVGVLAPYALSVQRGRRRSSPDPTCAAGGPPPLAAPDESAVGAGRPDS